MADVVTVPQAIQRARADNIPISEYTLRRLILFGAVPARSVGRRILIYYPCLVSYLRCEDGGDFAPATVAASGIRRVRG